jgi:hypothetical protein
LKAPISSTNIRLFFGAAVAALVIGGAGAAVASPDVAHVSAAATTIDRLVPIAKEHYAGEVSGERTIQTLHSLGSDPTLLRLLGSRDLTAARAYMARRYTDVWYHWHVSRMKIVQGSRLVSELGVPFVVPASHMTLRGTGGRNLGTLYVSMQDEIGFVRLMHALYPKLQLVIRSHRTHQLRTSMYSAAYVKLPSSGTVAIGQSRYLVRSFQEKDWAGEGVTIWLLMQG